MNLQVIASPSGEIVWVSGALPGSTHDLTCARIWGIMRELAAAGLITLADKGYIGGGEPVAGLPTPDRRPDVWQARRLRLPDSLPEVSSSPPTPALMALPVIPTQTSWSSCHTV